MFPRGTPDILLCFSCLKEDGDGKHGRLLTCSACKHEKYCSKACQRSDFARHKPVCASLASARAQDVSVSQPQKLFEKLGMEMMMRLMNSDEVPMILSLLLPSAEDAGEAGLHVLLIWDADAPDGSKIVVDRIGVMPFTDIGDASRDPADDMPAVCMRERLLTMTDEDSVGVNISFHFTTTLPGADERTMLPYKGSFLSLVLGLKRSRWNLRAQLRPDMNDAEVLTHFKCSPEDLTEKYGKQLHLEIR